MRRTFAAAILVLGATACKLDGPSPTPIDAAGGSPDAPIDAASACAACTPDQLCVQSFGGTCGQLSVACVTPTPDCAAAACTAGCDLDLCKGGDAAGILTCFAAGCPDEDPDALHCYGP